MAKNYGFLLGSGSAIGNIACLIDNFDRLYRRIFGCILLFSFLAFPFITDAKAQGQTQQIQQDIKRSTDSFSVPEFSAEDEDGIDDFLLEIQIPDSRRTASPEELEGIRFDVNDIILEGMTVYSDSEFIGLYENILGREVSLADLYQVADGIERKYREDDYVFSQAVVPTQRVGDGAFRIQIIETYISGFVIQGVEGPILDLMESYLNKILQSKPLRNEVMEHYLSLCREIPGISVKVSLRPSGTDKGATQLLVDATHKEIRGFTSISNRGSKYNGPWQGVFGMGLNSRTSKGERTTFLGMITRDFDEQRYASVSYEQAVGEEGLRIRVSGGHATLEPGFNLNQEGRKVESKASNLDIEILYPYIRSQEESLTFRANLAAKNSRTTLEDELFQKERLRSLSLMGDYRLSDSWGGVNFFTLGLHQGLNIFGSTEPRQEDPFITRTLAINGEVGAPDFIKFTAEVIRRQRLTQNLVLSASFKGQYSWDRLLSGEQFRVGGSSYGRGYDEGEISGDSGIGGLFELTYGEALSEGHFLGSLLSDFEFFGFYDVGQVWMNQNEQGLGEVSSASLASTGFGLRLRFLDGLSADFMYTLPLTRGLANNSSYADGIIAKHRRTGRYFFSLTSEF